MHTNPSGTCTVLCEPAISRFGSAFYNAQILILRKKTTCAPLLTHKL